MEHLTFALARHEDIPEIVAVYRSLIGTPGCTWNMDYPDERNALEDIEGNALFLLKDGGRIVAAASAGALDELGHLPWKPKNPCELARIGVVPDWQGRGVGTLMLRKIIEEMKARGFDGMCMLVSAQNPVALAMYGKIGIHKCGETFFYGSGYGCYQMVFGEANG